MNAFQSLWAGLYGLAHQLLSLVILLAICWFALKTMFGRK